jgi:small GTP-binding protein
MSAIPTIDVKVVLLGSCSVGKTSLIQRAVCNSFDPNSQPSVGVQFSPIFVTNSADLHIAMRIWDTAGQEKFRSMVPIYFQGSQIALLVFSLIDRNSLLEAELWVDMLHQGIEPSIFPQLYLVGNKVDLTAERVVTVAEAQALADKVNATYFETSARSGQNVADMFSYIADNVVPMAEEIIEPDPVSLDSPPTQSKPCC